MKKRSRAALLTAVLASALMAAGSQPAYAAGINPSSTRLTAKVDSIYTLQIPMNTDIKYNAAKTNLSGILTVKGNITANEYVEVTAAPKPLYNREKKTTLPYTLKNNGQVFTTAQLSDEDLWAALNGEGGKNLTLSVHITEDDWDAAKAGTYEGSIIFTAELLMSTQGN